MKSATVNTKAGFPILELDGATVSLTRNEITGQLYVYINTEDNDEHDGVGNPYVDVVLNDATLYDYGAEDSTPQLLDPDGSLEEPSE